MRSLVLLFPLVLVAAVHERAHASGCTYWTFSTTVNPPQGCEVVVYIRGGNDDPAWLEIIARRGTTEVDVTGTVTTSKTQIGVTYQDYDCNGQLSMQKTEPEEYTVYRATLTNAQVGDHLHADGVSLGSVTAASACSEAPMEQPYCTSLNMGYSCDPRGDDGAIMEPDDEPRGGCNAAGSSGLAVLALFALLLRRRRAALVLAPLLVASTAAADQPDAGVPGTGCFAPFTNAINPPINCPIFYYKSADVTEPPRAYVIRNGFIDVTGTVTKRGSVTIDYLFQSVCREDGRVVNESHLPWNYDEYEITITGANPGEELYIDDVNDVRLGFVAASGACPGPGTLPTMKTCTSDGHYQECEATQPDPETGRASGCNTGGSVGLVLALLALALRRRPSARTRAT